MCAALESGTCAQHEPDLPSRGGVYLQVVRIMVCSAVWTYDHRVVYPSPSDGSLDRLQSTVMTSKAVRNAHVRVCVDIRLHFFLGKSPGVELLGPTVTQVYVQLSKNLPNCFPKQLLRLVPHRRCLRLPVGGRSPRHWVWSVFRFSTSPTWVCSGLGILICSFPMTNDGEHLCMCLLKPSACPLHPVCSSVSSVFLLAWLPLIYLGVSFLYSGRQLSSHWC